MTTTTRFLTGVLLAAAGGPAFGQFAPRAAYGPPGAPPTEAGLTAAQAAPSATDRMERLTTMPAAPDPAAGRPVGLPPGSYSAPGYTDGPGCGGPLGGGPVAYDVYGFTGPSFVIASGDLASRMQTGWTVGGGGRSLFFTPGGDAAWAIDLGLSYTYNRGIQGDPITVLNRGTTTIDPVTGQQTSTAPTLQDMRLRGVHRTSFNFAVGRDWFFWGPGAPGVEAGWNARLGIDVGGRWGTAHVDMEPVNEPLGYFRRQDNFQGVFLGLNGNVEVPMGGWIWVAGARFQWGYDWTNLTPPADGDIQSLNFLLTTGFRF